MTSRRVLPCVSLHQPWAWALGCGLKHFENRTWKINYRGPFLIHASKALIRSKYDEAAKFIQSRRPSVENLVPAFEELPRGGIVAAGNLIEIYDKDGPSVSPWHWEGMYGWQFDRTIALPFRPLRGGQGLFYVNLTKEEAKLLAQGGIQ